MNGISDRKQQRGMTLAEVLVAMAIFAIIFVAALMIYDRSNRVFKSGVESAELQQNTRVAFDKMLQEIRMAGHDYDRDGFPTAAGQSQQPDEQIEYAGSHAITLRANLDFDEGNDRGREPALEAGSQFPVVTTGNDEIITYVLQSQTGNNPDSVTFFADVTDGTDAKREAYPGGDSEDEIVIDDVDLCVGGCNNPPYTLLRVTLDDQGNPVRTPLANNIRSMEFEYFVDAAGTNPLVIANPGGGQFDPANPSASATVRATRSRIRSIGVTIVGMSEAADPNFFDAAETLTTAPLDFTRYRKYRLETLVVARNLGKRGLREQQTAAPGPPTLDRAYFGLCGSVTLEWTAPPENFTNGSVESYAVMWDTNVGSTSPPLEAPLVGLGTSYTITGLDPNTTYRFTVAATNSWGTTIAGQYITGTPRNGTAPDSPTDLVASGAGTGGSALPNRIELGWTNPATNLSGGLTCVVPGGASCTGISPGSPHPGEARGVRIYRSTDMNFTPDATNLIHETSGLASSWIDTTASNCTDYYYRAQLVEYCYADNSQNVSGNIAQAISPIFPAAGEPGIPGRAESLVEPQAPVGLTVLDTSACVSGSCQIDLQWPEVKLDINGQQLAINQYIVYVTRTNGNVWGDSPYTATLDAGLTIDSAAGVARYSVLNLPQKNENAEPFIYEFTVAAVNCGIEGAVSPVARYPKCNFGPDSQVIMTVTTALGGDGTSSAPFEIEGDAALAFTTNNAAILNSLAVNVYDAATNALIDGAVGTPDAGPAAVLTVPWIEPLQDESLYRLDYTLTDASGCETSGSIFVRNVQVGCPFVVPVLPTLGTNTVTVPLKNNTEFEVFIRKLEFDWNETLANVNKDVDFVTVRYPTAPSGTLDCGAYDCVPQNSFTGDAETTGTITSVAPGGILSLPPSDTTGNYKLRIDYSVQGNGLMTASPVTRVVIHYKLLNDAAGAADRTCTVTP